METILWDRAKYHRLKIAYSKAVAQTTFEFEGHRMVTLCAKYLLEYLKPKFES